MQFPSGSMTKRMNCMKPFDVANPIKHVDKIEIEKPIKRDFLTPNWSLKVAQQSPQNVIAVLNDASILYEY